MRLTASNLLTNPACQIAIALIDSKPINLASISWPFFIICLAGTGLMKKLHPKHDVADDQTTCITNLEMPVCPPDITENGHSILPLPTKQKTSRTQATKCRKVLNHLRNLTFLVHEAEPLTALQATLFLALLELQQFVLTEDGIALENKESHQEDSSHFYHRPIPRQKQTPSLKENEREISTLAGLVRRLAQ